ncbi:MAG TPA: hypothetical protein VN578_15185 [Candidatus Binatia bacterium]|nr:hypothetical protein [Candidatus Binatia bacterium]
MKKLSVILTVALTLCTGSVSVRAHGCWGGRGCWPFWSFGIGLGVGTAVGCSWAAPRYPAYGYAYVYPPAAYTYVPPAAAYPAPASAYVQQPLSAPPPMTALASVWVPSTPGVGRWVPDPNPYRYQPAGPAGASSALAVQSDPTASAARSPGGAAQAAPTR